MYIPFSDLYQAIKNLNMKKRDSANEIVRSAMLWSMGAGLVPIPLLDVAVVTAVQLDMINKLCVLYEVEFSESSGKSFLSALAGGTVARLGASMIKTIPIIGTILGGVSMVVLAGATTYAVGQVFISHFEAHGTLKDFNIEAWKKAYEEQLEVGKELASKLQKEKEKATGTTTENSTRAQATVNSADEIFSKIEKLNILKEKGIITQEEFEEKKKALLRAL